MSDQNLTEESINNESITENESIQTDDVIEVDEEESKIEVIKINQEEEEEEKEETINDSIIDRNMNYPPYFEKDRRHGGMRNDFRGRDYRDFYDSRNMGRDFRGFRDRERDFDYPKFYGRGRDQRFFNKRDRDFKYKRDYYDDYNMRNMDKDMRMNNSMKECRVYVQNLSYDVTSEMLSRFMESVGKVVSAEILTSPDGRSKGCAIVQYETPNEARRAISDLQDKPFQGRPIHIREDREGMQYNSQMMQDKNNYMSDKQVGYQGEGSSNYQNTPKEQRIFVGNLDVSVTAEELRTLFEPAGTINYADVFQKDRNQSSKHEMFNGIQYRNRKLDVHEDRRGIVPVRRFNSYKSDKNISIHNASHHPYQPNSKPYPPNRGKAYPTHQPTAQHNSQTVPMPYNQSTNQTSYIQPMATTYSQPAQSTYAQPQGVQPTTSVPVYAGYPMADQVAAANSNVAAYQNSYQTAAYYSSISHQAQPVTVPASQPVQQPYPVATNVDYNNLYSAYYGQASQVGATTGYPMMTQTTTTATVQGQAGYTAEGSTLPTTYNYY
ncbi:hypothetical protein BCR32DRAFT_330919 [Anaeromyces robustus]|uniref:RRM domain-containing protein n=1 Tax=Anaeromyces robustus TaxID=1754192 RepID=A0A1Y1VPJ1_9FUNG|nr:hypothetical protein BCR32DRAFT_330919 [Anaeromyces robustus]|eukprot:ORX62521.1 hypothetical protein BCR32DRAFT_330919 [Anaeromyces robustus]